MARPREILLEVLSSITIIVSLFIIFGLVLFFINNPQAFERTRTVLSLVFEFFYVGTIATMIGRKIKKYYAELGTFTKAIMKFMVSEPLFIGMLFVFNIVLIAFFSYILPLHYISVSVIDRADSSILSAAVIEEKCVELNGKEYELQPVGTGEARYRTDRFLVWGDSAMVRVRAKECSEYSSFISWPGIPFRELFTGKRIDVDLLCEPDTVKIVVHVSEPAAATIHASAPRDATFSGAGVLYALRDETVRLNASHAGYADWETTFVATQDAELDISLEKRPGRVVLRAVNEGGTEIQRMDIYINGNLIGEKTGDVLVLAPGAYRVKMSRMLSGSERAVVDEFTITVTSGEEITEITRTARLERH
jgi:hypothetical protein